MKLLIMLINLLLYQARIPAENSGDTFQYLIGVIIGGIVSIALAYFTNVLGKRTEANIEAKDQKIMELEQENQDLKDDIEDLNKINGELETTVSAIELEFGEIRYKLRTFKSLYNIILNRYERDFADTPEQLDMLRDLKNMLK